MLSTKQVLKKRAKAYANAKELFNLFERQNCTTFCRDLIKYDLSNPEEAAKARQTDTFDKVYAKLVSAAVKNFLEQEQN